MDNNGFAALVASVIVSEGLIGNVHPEDRGLNVTEFQLSRLAKFIRRALERQYGYRIAIQAAVAPRL